MTIFFGSIKTSFVQVKDARSIFFGHFGCVFRLRLCNSEWKLQDKPAREFLYRDNPTNVVSLNSGELHMSYCWQRSVMYQIGIFHFYNVAELNRTIKSTESWSSGKVVYA